MQKSRRELLGGALRLAAATPLWTSAARAAVALVRTPYLQDVRTDRATVIWATSEASEASLEYSTDPTFASPVRVAAQSREYGTSATGLPAALHQHQAALAGLAPDTRYYYRILDGRAVLTPPSQLAEHRFRTAPVAGGFRFTVVGDSGHANFEQRDVRQRMLAEQPAFVLHTGDIAYPSGNFATFHSEYLEPFADLMRQIPMFPCVGNHDMETDQGFAYRTIHALPAEGVPENAREMYYSFDWGDAHMVSLDTNVMPFAESSAAMLAWLDRDLAATRKTWRIVFFHHPPFDILRGMEPESRAARERILPVLERHGVQLVLNGHFHTYQRSKPMVSGQPSINGQGIVAITTGGGGGGLHDTAPDPFMEVIVSAHHYVRVEVSGGRLAVRAIRHDGRDIDQFVIAPRPQVRDNAVVNAASFAPDIAAGSIVSIFGAHLCAESRRAEAFPLPTELAGIEVALNGRRVPLFYASPGQINAHLPFDVAGAATLRITTANGSTETPLRIGEAAPGIFSVVRADGALAGPAAPVHAGDFVTVFATGLGPVRGAIAAGQATPVAPLLHAAAAVEVLLGDLSAQPLFAGLTPGLAGLYQVNVQIPPGTLPGTLPLRLAAGGLRSNAIAVPVVA